MTGRFGPAALRRAALAARLLGWPPETFWAATPCDLATALAPLSADGEPPDRATIEQMIERDRHG